MSELSKFDFEIYNAIKEERLRQETHLEMIASENFVSNAVLEAQGSIMTNKYAEGYSGRRYYGGCEYVDVAENLAIERACKLFNVKYANVQPHSGSQANMAVYRALLTHGDKIMGMSLDAGGHLTHGYQFSFSGQDYESYPYGLNPETEMLDYDQLEQMALEIKPKMIVAGASAYPRAIDFKRLREIADKVGAYLFVDMAHIAGLVAAGYHQNPCEYADIVSTTTHKTLRGPRGGMILTNNEDIIKAVNKTVFPRLQGGPLMHVIAAKAVAFKEALQPEFKEYARNIIVNCKALSDRLVELGYHVISGGTDNHLILLDVKSATGLTGKAAETLLHSVNITTNKNSIPNDPEKPAYTSGLRLGTAALTSRGFAATEMVEIADLIDMALRNAENEKVLNEVKNKVIGLTKKHPLWYSEV